MMEPIILSNNIIQGFLENDVESELCQFAADNADFEDEIELDDGEGHVEQVPVTATSIDRVDVSLDTFVARFREREVIITGECSIGYCFEYQILDGDKYNCWYETVAEESGGTSAKFEIAVVYDSTDRDWYWSLVNLW
jgi:hypothetical protein